jgi:hypothetical protein
LLNEEILESVEAAKAPGTFNILNVLQGRGYPSTTVDAYMDESAIYDMSIVVDKLDKLDSSLGKNAESEKQKKYRDELMSEREELQKKLDASKYIVHLSGISEGRREEVYRLAVKKYPIEYESSNAISNLLGADSSRVEKQSPERDALFTDYLWQEHIKKISNPDGDEQSEFSYSTIRAMRDSFPISAIMKINEAIDKLRTASALFTVNTGEDFLAKP